jgi:hypothetical protein
MLRSQLSPMPPYFDRYINLCDEVEITQAIQTSIQEAEDLSLDKCKALGNTVYAPGKWTVKDILQHLIDTERIFAFRALAFARGETTLLPSYDEDAYAQSAQANKRTVESLREELITCHHSLKQLYHSFSPAQLSKSGRSFKGDYSVASIGFLLPGHQRWHFKVMEERYFVLLK